MFIYLVCSIRNLYPPCVAVKRFAVHTAPYTNARSSGVEQAYGGCFVLISDNSQNRKPGEEIKGCESCDLPDSSELCILIYLILDGFDLRNYFPLSQYHIHLVSISRYR